MKSDNVPHFILNSPGCLAFKLTVYVRILCVYQRIHVCVCVRGGHQTNREMEMERACRFRGKHEMCFFTSVIRVRPPIGMKRSLIKSELGRGAVGWGSIARG